MQKNIENRTVALAALFQCVEGVGQIANKGTVDSDLFKTCIDSILVEDVNTIEDIYGSLHKLQTGFKVLMYQLGGEYLTHDGRQKNLELTRYAINLLHLERKLSTDDMMFKALLDGIVGTQRQLEHFESTHPTVTSHLAEIYAQTISKLGPRIMVKGDQNHLGNPENAAKIRALLLAGIRAALLWRQAGGNRWKLMLERGKLQKRASQFLEDIKKQAYS